MGAEVTVVAVEAAADRPLLSIVLDGSIAHVPVLTHHVAIDFVSPIGSNEYLQKKVKELLLGSLLRWCLSFLGSRLLCGLLLYNLLGLGLLGFGSFFGFLNLANLELASTLTGILSLDNGSSSKGLSESKLQGSSSLGSINLVVGNNVL